MRNIVNISLPKEMVVDIKRGVKAGFALRASCYHLIREWNMEQLVQTVEKSALKSPREGKVLRLLRAVGA